MSRLTSGSLYVDAYTPTGNIGEYTFESGLFVNQNDTGNGAYDILPGFVLFISPTDLNTGMPITGYSNRYKLTNVNILDSVRVSGTIIWDSTGIEDNPPSNGVFSIISDTTPNLKLAIPAVDNNYIDLNPGSTISAVLNDMLGIIDNISVGNQTPAARIITTLLPIITNGQTIFSLPNIPNDKENIIVTVNGLKYIYGVANDFTIEGLILTWTDVSLVLESTDALLVSYTY